MENIVFKVIVIGDQGTSKSNQGQAKLPYSTNI